MKDAEFSYLAILRAWSHWYFLVSRYPEYLPGRRILRKGFEVAEKSLQQQSRKGIIRLAQLGRCISCGEKINVYEGDHIIPLSWGAPYSVENFMPLCKRCNSSKGNKDLLEWWIVHKKKHIKDLNQDALTIYLRLRYKLRDKLKKPFPLEPLKIATFQARETIPKELYLIWNEGVEKYNLIELKIPSQSKLTEM